MTLKYATEHNMKMGIYLMGNIYKQFINFQNLSKFSGSKSSSESDSAES
jgi:hypothetical protein